VKTWLLCVAFVAVFGWYLNNLADMTTDRRIATTAGIVLATGALALAMRMWSSTHS